MILETEWVLRFAYGFSPTDIANALRKLLGLPNVYVNESGKLAKIIEWHEHELDFTDAFHLANSVNLSALLTFDRKFVKRAKGLSTCQMRKL